MRKRYIFLGIAGVLAAGVGATVYMVSPTVHAGQTGESPELGRTGDYPLGTMERDFTMADRTTITTWGAISGNLATVDRTLSVRFWYPAQGGTQPGDQPVSYRHELQLPGNEPVAVVSDGIAMADADPLTDERFPLVLMSHGYGGWNTQFSNLAEHIASRGYIVASINHEDMPASGVTSFMLSFGNVLADRMLDQRLILDQILSDARGGEAAYAAQINPDRVGLIGYSMGGYGAIANAGAPYAVEDGPLSNIPDSAQQNITQALSEGVQVHALVAFAPWGGQPDSRAWSAENLSNIDIPVLLVAGNQDDIVNYDEGITWLFENLTGTDRYMLVFREARHNIVGNQFDFEPDTIFAAHEALSEPVWRSDRLNAINQHFVTAFLDLVLKGDEEKARYLNVPTVDSNDSEWPLSFAEQLNGTLAGPENEQHWQGFQRRWAVGLEMHRASRGE